MRICPNDKVNEIFVQRFHYFENPFYKFFALNLLFQDTSYSLALKYSCFLFKFFSFAFYNINFWFKISKMCPNISHFSHSRGNTDDVNSHVTSTSTASTRNYGHVTFNCFNSENKNYSHVPITLATAHKKCT